MDRAQNTILVEALKQVPDYPKRKGRQPRWMTLRTTTAENPAAPRLQTLQSGRLRFIL